MPLEEGQMKTQGVDDIVATTVMSTYSFIDYPFDSFIVL